MSEHLNRLRAALQTLQRIDTYQLDAVDLHRIETAKRDLKQTIEAIERENGRKVA